MSGTYDGEITAGEIKRHGDLGIAVADALGGEMMLVDGIWYQVLPGGRIQVADDNLTVPFGMAAFFKPSIEFTVGPTKTYQELRAEVDKHLPSRNVFYAVKIEGTFTNCEKPYLRQTNEALP